MNKQLEQIGGGKEKQAYALDEKTIRLFLGDITDVENRGFFLLYKIAHLLFPENIPDPKETGRDERRGAYVDIERVPHDAFHARVQLRLGNRKKPPIDEHNEHEVQYYEEVYAKRSDERRAFLRKMMQAGLVNVDSTNLNFSHHEGRLVYFDMARAWAGKDHQAWLRFERPRLEKAIQNIPQENIRKQAQGFYKELLSVIPQSAL